MPVTAWIHPRVSTRVSGSRDIAIASALETRRAPSMPLRWGSNP
jgi:hypothetical protein